MQKVRDFFERLANNALAATALSKQVQDMQQNVNELGGVVERLKTDVTYYSDQAQAFRKKSEDLDRDLLATRRDRDELSRKLDDATHTMLKQDETLETAAKQINNLVKDRDDAQLRVMELEDTNKTLIEKLGAIQKLLYPLVPMQDLPNPLPSSPSAEPTNPVPISEPVGQPEGASLASILPPSEPAPSPQKPLTHYDKGFDWNKPNHWDDTYHNDNGTIGAYVQS